MGIVHTAEWKLTCSPEQADERFRRAFVALGMAAEGPVGSINGTAKRSLRRNRWAAGAAVHFLDGRNGVKDLDVWTFFARHPEGEFPPRWRRVADFGPSELGRHPNDPGFVGRKVNLIGRSLDAGLQDDPVDAIRSYLRARRTESARPLATKGVIAIDPPDLQFEVDPPRIRDVAVAERVVGDLGGEPAVGQGPAATVGRDTGGGALRQL